MMRTRSPRPTLLLAVALAIAPVLVGCGSGSGDATGPAASGPTRTSDTVVGVVPTTTAGDATTTTTSAKASRTAPLAERVFRVHPKPSTPTERAAVQALEGYLDGLITAFATNDVARSGVGRFTTPEMYADARRLIAEQVKEHYILYGGYTFTIRLRGASSRAAVIGSCVDQSRTQRHNPSTDAAGRWNNTPYVRVNYTLNRLDVGWVVVDYSGREVASCPG
jgi:hypothetical protein